MVEGFERYGRGMGARRYPWLTVPIGILVLIWGGYVVVTNALEGDWLVAIGVGWFSLALGLGGIGVGFANRADVQDFVLRDAAAWADSDEPPPDARVHLARMRALPYPLVVCAALFALGMALISATALLQLLGLVPRAADDVSTGTLLLAAAGSAVLAGIGGWLARQHATRKWRGGALSRRPEGVALGEREVLVRVPGYDAEIAWAHILAVRPDAIRDGMAPVFRLELSPEAGIRGDAQLIPAGGYSVPTDALYSALRWYRAHPEARHELGREAGGRRLADWCRLARKLR